MAITYDLPNHIYGFLDDTASIEALIGSPPRAYSVEAPQNVTLPYVVFSEVSKVSDWHVGGDATGILRTRVQFDIYATTAAKARAIGRAFHLALNGFSGQLGDATGGSSLLDVRHVTLDGQGEDKVPPADGSGRMINRYRMDFLFIYREPVTNF